MSAITMLARAVVARLNKPPKPKFDVPVIGTKAAEWEMYHRYERAQNNWRQDRGNT